MQKLTPGMFWFIFAAGSKLYSILYSPELYHFELQFNFIYNIQLMFKTLQHWNLTVRYVTLFILI